MAFKRSDVPGEDIKRAMGMTEVRRKLIEATPAAPLQYEFGVNKLAKALHPGTVKACITSKEPCGTDCCRITFKAEKFPYFRAGQFITLSCRVNDSYLSRPYSICSSPKEALGGKLEIIVQKKGIFSSYLIDEAPVGAELLVGEPSGDFFHDDIRDREHILAVAGGSGVTPFLSMMKAVCEGSEDFRITLIYGARTKNSIVFCPEEFKDPRIEIVPVLSEEEVPGYRYGFITADILKEYLSGETSVFMCGLDAMYSFVRKGLDELGFDPSRIRQERNSIGVREVSEIAVYKLTVHIRDQVWTIDARNNETIVTAMERAGIPAPVRCRSGVCGFCHSRLICGDYYVAPENDFRRSADRKFGYIHPCSTYPESDMEIEVPIFEE